MGLFTKNMLEWPFKPTFKEKTDGGLFHNAGFQVYEGPIIILNSQSIEEVYGYIENDARRGTSGLHNGAMESRPYDFVHWKSVFNPTTNHPEDGYNERAVFLSKNQEGYVQVLVKSVDTWNQNARYGTWNYYEYIARKFGIKK